MSEDSHEPGLGTLLIGALGLGVPGILLILLAVGGISIFAGFAIYSIVNFVSQWFVVIVPLIAGIIATYELAPYGPKYAVIGITVLILAIVAGFIARGIIGDPTNTYNLLMSVAPGSTAQSVAIPFVVFFWVVAGAGVFCAFMGMIRLGQYIEAAE